MSFLNPIMLLGVAAVAVPIIIHLLNRRKFQKVVWAAMRFLKVSVEQNQRRMRIEDLLLLVLRCLLLVLLALALARPAIMSKATDFLGQSKVTGVIILDNSYSMGMSDGSQTRFDKARKTAEQALDSMPVGSATAVLLASDVVDAAIPEPTFDFNLARKILREATLSDRATDLFPAIDKALDLLQGRSALRKEVYLVTDGQALGWRQLSDIQKTLEKSKNEIRTHIILINEHEERNLGVSDLRMASGLSPMKQALRFEVKVSNYGKDPARDARVSLNINNEPPSDEFTIENLPPGTTRSVSLFAKLPSEGFHSITARIPEDRLHADDKRTMAVRTVKEVRVLLVDGDPGSEPRESHTFFLKNALLPVTQEALGDYFIKVTAITWAELGNARLDDFDTVVLANVPEFSEATLKGIEYYLHRGGGLIIFPGPKVNATFYNEQLLNRFQFLPAALGAPRGQADQDEKFFTLQPKDFEHSIVSIWNDPASGLLGSARFYRAFDLVPPPAPLTNTPAKDPKLQKTRDAGEPRIVLKYADGAPAVMERNWGLGKVVLFSSTANTAWNDFPVRLAYVPLMHRVLGAIIQRQDEGLNLRVGEKFTRRVRMEYLDKDATFLKPGQTESLRDLRRVTLSDASPVLQYDRTDKAGIYEVNVGEPPLALKFAAQANPSESSLEELSPGQLDALKNVAQVITWAPNISLRNMVEKQRSGIEFWLPLIAAALMLGLVETFLGQWFSRSK